MSNKLNVLILRPDHIGDMLLTTPFLSALRKAFPEWHITVLCGSWSAPILENNPNYDEIVICNYPWLARGHSASWKPFLATIKRMRSRKFDIVINLRKATKATIVAYAIKGKETWGFDVPKCAWAHTHKVHYDTDSHIADLYLEFVPRNYRIHNGLELYLTKEECNSSVIKGKFAVIAPEAGYSEKLWVGSRWTEIVDWLTYELNIPVLFIGGKTLSIREVAVRIERASFIVSVDSAPMHIASAVKTPVVALFGYTNPVQWGSYPNGCPNQVVNKTDMELITVDDVKSAVRELLEGIKNEEEFCTNQHR